VLLVHESTFELFKKAYLLSAVTRGLVPRVPITAKTIGMAGTSPAMTAER
jgi:hypothetical protein